MRSPLSHFGIRLPLFLLFGFVYLLIFAIDSSPISSITGWDNSIWRIIGRGWTQGFIPYRDLWDNKGPYQLLIYVIGYLINPGKWGVFILEIINFSFVLELLYRIGRLYTSSWKKLTVAFGCFLLFFVGTAGGDGQTEEWSLCFTLLSLLLYLKYEKSRFINHPYSYTFVYGLCAGVVLLIRPNNAYIIAAVILALIVEYIWDKRFRQLLMHGLTFLGGVATTTLPMVAYFYMHNALYDMYYALYLFYDNYLGHCNVFYRICNQVPYFSVVIVLLLSKVFFDTEKCKIKSNLLYFMLILLFFPGFPTRNTYDHYYLIIAPLFFMIPLFFDNLYISKNKIMAICFVMLSFLPFYQKIYYNVVGNYGLKNEQVREIIKNHRLPLTDHQRETDRIMALIPWGERKDIFYYEFHGNLDAIIASGESPCMRFFASQKLTMRYSHVAKSEILAWLKFHRPLWIITYVDPDELISPVLEDYDYVTSYEKGAVFRLKE